METDDHLEHQLQKLGLQERELEERIKQHRADIGALVGARKFYEADLVSDFLDELQRALAALRPRITDIEIKLYARRRRKRT